MVKFSQTFESQVVPEWRDAYCDYDLLKKDLKDVRYHPNNNFSLGSPNPHRVSSFNVPSFKHMTTLARHVSQKFRDAAVKVHLRHRISAEVDRADEFYETELLMPTCGTETDKIFFARLDAQLNKVNDFYKKKEQEFLKKGEDLKQQLEMMNSMWEILAKDPEHDSLSRKDSDESQLEGFSNHSTELADVELATIKEESCSNKGILMNPKRNIELKINIDTPSIAIAALADRIIDGKNNPNQKRAEKKKLKHAKKLLKAACIELYRGLALLRTYSTLNFRAFSKVLKKYDKKSGVPASVAYMKVVESAYFNSSDKVPRFMYEMEKIFTNNFADGDHKKAMTFLRATRQTASHKVTFFTGLFTGTSVACLIAFFLLLDMKWFDGPNPDVDADKETYLRAMFPVFSVMFLMLLHLIIFGWNLYSWRVKRINYTFIFGLSPQAEMKYREVFLIATSLLAVVTATLLGHFLIYTNLTTDFRTILIPLSILVAFIAVLVCPFNICFRASRAFLWVSFWHLIMAPFYKVVMPDFYLGDQLTSQVYLFRSIEYVMCYSTIGHFDSQVSAICSGNSIAFKVISYWVSLLPYWWRFLQCLRRWYDEGDVWQLINAGKYFSAIIAAAMALTYRYHESMALQILFIIVSGLVALGQLYWDIVIDWGLLQTNSKNYLLRDKLMLRNKKIYFLSMGLNTVLRFAWLQSITQIEFFGVDRRISDLFFASLEIIRRGQWNFYRLENEHLNNVGKFRATLAIPLPFASSEVDD